MTDTELKALSDDDLDALRIQVLNEQERRQRLASAPAQVTQIATAYVADGGDLTVLTQAMMTSTDEPAQ